MVGNFYFPAQAQQDACACLMSNLKGCGVVGGGGWGWLSADDTVLLKHFFISLHEIMNSVVALCICIARPAGVVRTESTVSLEAKSSFLSKGQCWVFQGFANMF